MQNKYVGERRGNLKKTHYMIWKKNLDEMEVENFFKASVRLRWAFNQELTYAKTAMGILLLMNSKCEKCEMNTLKTS